MPIDMANTLKAQNCRFLEDQVKATRNNRSTPSDFLVIGEVLSAKKSILLFYKDDAGAVASLSLLRPLLSISGKAEHSAEKIISIEYEQSLPIALRPAFVPSQFPGPYWGRSGKRPRVEIKWGLLNPNDPIQRRQIDFLSRDLFESQESIFFPN